MPDSSEGYKAAWIAVIGMAGRFPGARNVTELWRNLRDGVESISFLSDEQLRAAGVSAGELTSPDYVRAAAVLEGVDLFDAEFFGFSPKDASIMDPQHRHFLECAWEALENAAWCPDQFDGRIGVYAGSGINSYLINNLLTNSDLVADAGIFLLKQTGNDKDVLATRVSYQFGLTGPSLSVQTACSTSLVAIHLACQSLLNHECDMALAGGVTIEIPHGRGYVYREGEILSRDGHCRAFDADASGTIFGSGAGIVVLRRLEDALSDGDFIHAIVRGTAINNDGARKVGYLAPSVAGQTEVIAEALAIAGVEPDSISYIETHGTGTAVGDPIEIRALTSAFNQATDQKSFCAIGSLKTNIGHLDAAAGIAGFIKTVLALEHGQIPPSLNFSKPNQLIDFENSPFFVNTQLRRWETNGHPRRAGITSLGIGGTNAHAVLEEAPATASGGSRHWQLLTLSAKTLSAVDARCRELAEHLLRKSEKLADVAFTCHLGRKAFAVRRAIVSHDAVDAADALLHPTSHRVISGPAPDRSPAVVFLFSGQGSQFCGMGRGLYESEDEFRKEIDFCAEFLNAGLGLDLRSLLLPSKEDAEDADRRLNETRLTQPALFVVEYAMAKLWQTWGIQPAAMIGHSIGEFAAACVAGVFSLESALEIVAERARLMQTMPGGAMAAVSLREDRIRPLLGKYLCLAGVNSNQQCVVSGSESSISEMESSLSAEGIACQRLRVSHAFHSSMMDPVLRPFSEFLSKFDYSPPRIPFISSATGNWITAVEACDPAYWAHQLRNAVRFSDGMSNLLNKESAIFLEVGPGQTLLALAAQHSNFASRHELIASMRSRREPLSDLEVLLKALGKLWVAGAKIDWEAFHAHERRKRLPLPTYPFQRKSFWVEPERQPSKIEPAPDNVPDASPIVGEFFHPVWKRSELDSTLSRADVSPWLILQTSHGLGAQIAQLARRRGEQCVEVIPGDRFARLSGSCFQIDVGARGDYVRLIAELKANGKMPRTVVHLWSLVDEDSVRDVLESLNAIENRTFYSLLFLAQALGAEDIEARLRIGVVSNSLQSVAEEPISHPERAVLLGPCGVIPKEFPNIDCSSIDVVLPPQMDTRNGAQVEEALREIGARIVSELSFEFKAPMVAYRGNRRWVRGIEPLLRGPDPIALVDRGVYLITGGLGGIGMSLAQSLARSARARLVLMGRSAFPPRGDWDSWLSAHDREDPVAQKILKILAIEGSGGEVLVLAADVSNAEEMRGVISKTRERFGKIDAVIHAAGVLEDAPILKKDTASVSRILAPKVRGTLVLESVLADDPPALFVVMSSLSALLAPPGQVDYVGANTFLDTFAAARSSRQRLTISIQWPRWRDVGMAADPTKPKSDNLLIHPLLQKLVKDDEFERIYASQFNFDKEWIFKEHRLLGGAGLFPGTGYLEMIRAAFAADNHNSDLSIRNLRFEVPLRVEIGSNQAVRLTIRKRGKQYAFIVAESVGSESDRWIVCARGDLTLVEKSSAFRVNLRTIRRRCKVRTLVFSADRQNAKQERYISFGPRWRCLRRIFLGRGEALSEVELPNSFTSDLATYSLHPAILDVATGSAMFLIPGYDQLEYLYVPVAYGAVSIRRPLPRKCYAHIRVTGDSSSDNNIRTFDISILDESGRLLVEISDYTIRQIRDPAVLDRGQWMNSQQIPEASQVWSGPRAPGEIEASSAISSQQGVRAFGRLLGGWFAPNVTVFMSDLVALLEKPDHSSRSLKLESSIGGEDAPPDDEIEVALANWWKELLGLSEIGRQANFFELGGQSLSAIRLLTKIKKAYGIELNPSAMFEVPTIEGLARLIRRDEIQDSYSSVVRMQREGSGPPLFLVHALGGRVIGYNDLLRHLNRNQPVFGLEFDFATARPIEMRMEFLAAHYIRNIRTVQAVGPYYLLGYSFGGLMAFEIAQQLQEAGETVAFLGMLDTWQPKHLRSLDDQRSPKRQPFRRIELRILRAKNMLASQDPSTIKEELRERGVRFWNDLTGLGLRTIYSIYGTFGFAVPRRLQRPQEINWFALARYNAHQYPGRITLFRADEGIASIDDRYGEELGWDGLAKLGIEVHKIPGSHFELMKEPNVRILAQKLDTCLERYRGDGRTGNQDLQKVGAL
jgi:acyl transferase domain-containing protein/thioesterase domain-containing protein/acyl carrier protein